MRDEYLHSFPALGTLNYEKYDTAIKQEFRKTPENEITGSDFPDIESAVLLKTTLGTLDQKIAGAYDPKKYPKKYTVKLKKLRKVIKIGHISTDAYFVGMGMAMGLTLAQVICFLLRFF